MRPRREARDRARAHAASRSCLAAALALSAPRRRRRRRTSSCSATSTSTSPTTSRRGPTARDFFALMADKVERAAVFGIPLQQMWDHENSGDYAPTYYLQTDAPLYYYSFTDAWVAMQYRSLTKEQQARLDPMITGFNPADMYAADHIRRVLETFPGVFTGIGEFTIHKEFVSAKIAGGPGESGRPRARSHSRLRRRGRSRRAAAQRRRHAVPEAGPGALPAQAARRRSSGATRRPPSSGRTSAWAAWCDRSRTSSASSSARSTLSGADAHVYFDISWDEVAKYIVASPEAIAATAALINRYPDRFLFGSDEVGPTDPGQVPEGLRHVRAAVRGARLRRRASCCARVTIDDCSTRPGARCGPGKQPTRKGERDDEGTGKQSEVSAHRPWLAIVGDRAGAPGRDGGCPVGAGAGGHPGGARRRARRSTRTCRKARTPTTSRRWPRSIPTSTASRW